MNATLTRISHQLDTVAGVVTVTIPGDILSTNADALRAELFDLLEAPQIKGSPWHTLKLDLTGAQMAKILSDGLGKEVVYNYVPPEVYRTFGFPGADDLSNMFQYNRDFDAEFCGSRDLAFSRSLNPKLQTFAQWMAAHKDRIPVA